MSENAIQLWMSHFFYCSLFKSGRGTIRLKEDWFAIHVLLCGISSWSSLTLLISHFHYRDSVPQNARDSSRSFSNFSRKLNALTRLEWRKFYFINEPLIRHFVKESKRYLFILFVLFSWPWRARARIVERCRYYLNIITVDRFNQKRAIMRWLISNECFCRYISTL